MTRSTPSRRSVDLAPEDAALVGWAEDGYPPGLEAFVRRLGRSGILTVNVNQGWWPLLRDADAEITAIAPGCRVARVGEELGVLVLEVAPEDLTEEIENILEGARSASTHTCEICAGRGSAYRQADWLITLCLDHARARGARRVKTDADIAEAAPRPIGRELAFALSAGVPAPALTSRARHRNEAYARGSAEADEAELASWLTSTEVARLMGRSVGDVDHLRKQGELHAARRRTGRYAFPRWQFDRRNQPLIGSKRVLAALNDDDPINVSSIMTTPLEELDGLAPAQWLARRHSVRALVGVLREADRLTP